MAVLPSTSTWSTYTTLPSVILKSMSVKPVLGLTVLIGSTRVRRRPFSAYLSWIMAMVSPKRSASNSLPTRYDTVFFSALASYTSLPENDVSPKRLWRPSLIVSRMVTPVRSALKV